MSEGVELVYPRVDRHLLADGDVGTPYTLALSINAVAGYPTDMQVHIRQPVRPYNFYGATKAWGEALACHYAESPRRTAPAPWLQVRSSESTRAAQVY